MTVSKVTKLINFTTARKKVIEDRCALRDHNLAYYVYTQLKSSVENESEHPLELIIAESVYVGSVA